MVTEKFCFLPIRRLEESAGTLKKENAVIKTELGKYKNYLEFSATPRLLSLSLLFSLSC